MSKCCLQQQIIPTFDSFLIHHSRLMCKLHIQTVMHLTNDKILQNSISDPTNITHPSLLTLLLDHFKRLAHS